MDVFWLLAFFYNTIIQGALVLSSTTPNTSLQTEILFTDPSYHDNGTVTEQNHERSKGSITTSDVTTVMENLHETTKTNVTVSGLVYTGPISSTMANVTNGTKDDRYETLELVIAVICLAEVFLIAAVCFVWKARRNRDNFFRLHDVTEDNNKTSEEVTPKSIIFNRKSRMSQIISQNGGNPPNRMNSYTQTENDLTTSVENQRDSADQNSKIERNSNSNECTADLKRKSGSSIRSWILRSSSFRISQLFGRRASKSKCTSGVYEEPWDNSTLSGNIRNPTSKFYVDIEDEEDDTQEAKQKSLEMKSMETITESSQTFVESTQL